MQSSEAAHIARRPYLTIRPSRGWQAINVRELWQFRDLFHTLALRDVKLRYRQTALGAIWVILQPLLAAGIFSFVFGKVARLPSNGIPYFVFSYAGLLGWNAFSSTLQRASACLVGNSPLLSKVYFPRLTLPLSTVLATLIDFGVALAMMAVLMAAYHVAPGLSIILLPIWLTMLLLLALGLGMYASALMVTYRDVTYVMPVLIQFLLYASPVAYAISAVPHHLRGFYMLNPLAGLLEAMRWSLLGGGAMAWGPVLYGCAVSLVVFFLGALSFKRMERRFADVI